jgi:hypothetical protein
MWISRSVITVRDGTGESEAERGIKENVERENVERGMWNGEMWKSGALAPRKAYVESGL